MYGLQQYYATVSYNDNRKEKTMMLLLMTIVHRATRLLVWRIYAFLSCLSLNTSSPAMIPAASSSLPLQTLSITRTRPNPPTPNSIILGTVTRLSPLQATVSITVVDGIPLPAGEEFSGVIRVQDVRATEKDKVKIADCFRGGDVVKGLVVR